MKNRGKIKKILEKVWKEISLSKDEKKEIEEETKKFIELLKKVFNKHEIFIGGSLAKGTLFKKRNIDIDIFVRFKNERETEKFYEIEKKFKIFDEYKIERIHGSRDYYKFHKNNLIFEVVPVLKVKKEEAENTTDLSYFHVKYVKEKIKENKKLIKEIVLAKTFAYASRCYGAESHIKGFSGYSIELLIIYYKSFLKFIEKIIESKGKIIIDIEKHYKNKNEVMNNINEAKLNSPIIIVDPTFKLRNVCAALSYETFEKFKKYCKEFLRKPSKKYFDRNEIDIKRKKELVNNKKGEIYIIIAYTDKQPGAIAGSKLLKFFNFLKRNVSRYFNIIDFEFFYDEKKSAELYFIIKSKKEIIIEGPPIHERENVKKFKKKHKKVFIINNRIYSKKIMQDFKKFLKEFLKKYKNEVEKMGITKVKIKKA